MVLGKSGTRPGREGPTGRGHRPLPVRQTEGASRRMPRFGPKAREVPRRRALAPRKFGLEPKLPLPHCLWKPRFFEKNRVKLWFLEKAAPGPEGRGLRGGVTDPSPVRQTEGASRRMPRFGPKAREVPRRRALAPRKFGLEPKLPLPHCLWKPRFFEKNRVKLSILGRF